MRLSLIVCGVLGLGFAGCTPDRGGGQDDPDLRGGGGADLPRPACAGRGCDLPKCRAGESTDVVGRLLAGNGADPVPGAAVYVPTFDLPELAEGASCDLCNQIPMSVASTLTAFDGTFRLKGVPAGLVPIVAQLGHFRRALEMQVNPCVENSLPADPSTSGKGMRLPRRTGELSPQDTVPRIAVASGDYDQIECVLKRMGVDELTIYNGRAAGSQNPPAVAELEALLTDKKTLLAHQILIVNCTDNQYQRLLARPDVKANLEAFTTAGGRLYVTDWAYDVVEQVPQFSPYLCFEPQNPPAAPMCLAGSEPAAAADSRDPYGGRSQVLDMEMARWLAQFPGVIDGSARVNVDYSFVIVAKASQEPATKTTVWVEGPTPKGVRPLTVTFDYKGCGRVHFSTYNTEPNGVVEESARWPTRCKGDFSPQERLLEYLLFNVAACIGPIG